MCHDCKELSGYLLILFIMVLTIYFAVINLCVPDTIGTQQRTIGTNTGNNNPSI